MNNSVVVKNMSVNTKNENQWLKTCNNVLVQCKRVQMVRVPVQVLLLEICTRVLLEYEYVYQVLQLCCLQTATSEYMHNQSLLLWVPNVLFFIGYPFSTSFCSTVSHLKRSIMLLLSISFPIPTGVPPRHSFTCRPVVLSRNNCESTIQQGIRQAFDHSLFIVHKHISSAPFTP